VDRGQPGLTGRCCAVLGSPVAHSLSPALHRAAYRHLGLDWHYEAIRVEETELAGFLAGLGPQWRGLSVTMPLKARAARLADRAEPLVRAVGAANTLVRGDDGAWEASNTDVPGVVAALSEAGVDRAEAATVLGAGATAASAVAALVGVVDELTVCARTPARAAPLAALASGLGMPLRVVGWDQVPEWLGAPVVVSTAPAGAADPWVGAVPPRPGTLLDVVYVPWPTPLAAAWAAGGGRVVGGLDLLVHQAALQVRLMTGSDVPVAVLRDAGEQARAGT
jgi:shikimate dehydrogenase